MKGDQMGILAAYPTQRELPLSNQTRFRMPQADRTRQSASARFVMEGAMRRAVVIASAFVTFGFLAGESWAGSISLKDRYIRVHILRACFEANGQSTGGTGPGGYGCKT